VCAFGFRLKLFTGVGRWVVSPGLFLSAEGAKEYTQKPQKCNFYFYLKLFGIS
jgi:hypothetical protein